MQKEIGIKTRFINKLITAVVTAIILTVSAVLMLAADGTAGATVTGCVYASSISIPLNVTATVGLDYEYSGYQTYYVSKGTAIAEDIVIPALWDDGTNGEHPVVSINGDGFRNYTNLKSITLPEGIMSIGDYAFYNTGLHNITIPSTVTGIGEYAFGGLVETISYIRFLGNIPFLLGSPATTFPARCLIIVPNAALYTVYISAWTSFSANQFINYETATANGTLNDDWYSYAQGQYTKHLGNNSNVVIPDTYSYNGGQPQPIMHIVSYAIYNQRLQSIVMPSTITYIGMYFFEYSSQIANVQNVYFKGTEAYFKAITIDSTGNSLKNVNLYYYSATEPESDGNFWYYDEGTPTVWATETDISSAEITLSQYGFTYNKTPQMPTATVRLGQETLTSGVDYTLSYYNTNGGADNVTDAGTVTVTVTGTGEYSGAATAEYTINKAPLTWEVGTTVQNKTYDGTTNANLENPNFVWLRGMISGDGITGTSYGASVRFVSPNAGESVAVVAEGYSFSGFPGRESNYYLTGQPVFPNAKISPRQLIVTPDAKSKQYGAGDPEFTFNRQEIEGVISGYNTISGNTDSLTGSLGREIGSAVRTYNFTAGSLTAGANYVISMNLDNKFTITRADGASVSAPSLSDKTHDSITVNAVSSPANGQSVEYGIADSPASGPAFQDGMSFTGLKPNTTYYIYARAKTNENYNTGSLSAFLQVTTNAAPVPPTITTISLAGGTVDVAYSQTLTVTGDGQIIWSVQSGSLPSGLTLNANGTVTGTPTAAGTFSFTVKAENGISPDGTKQLSITVSKGGGANVSAPTESSVSGNSITVNAVAPPSNGQSVEYAISTGNSATDITDNMWQDGTAFTGLSPDTNYYIFARAKGNDDYNAGVPSAALLVTTLNPQPPVITTDVLGGGAAGAEYKEMLSATGDDPIVWSVIGGNLPVGLSLKPNGELSGTPTSAGTFTFTVIAENDVGNEVKQFIVTIVKGGGAAVTVPSNYAATVKTESGITVPALESLSNGQTVEYAISKTNSTGGLTWQDGAAFTNLDADTTYYVFVRSKANGDYNAGDAVMVLEVKTDADANGGDGFPVWAIAVIAVGSVAVLGGAGFGIWLVIRKKKAVK